MRPGPLITRIALPKIDRRTLTPSSRHFVPSHRSAVLRREVLYVHGHAARPHWRRHRYRTLRSSRLFPQTRSPPRRQVPHRVGNAHRLSGFATTPRAVAPATSASSLPRPHRRRRAVSPHSPTLPPPPPLPHPPLHPPPPP